MLGAALAQLGRLEEARSAVESGLALNPAFSISRARDPWMAMSDHPTYVAQLEPLWKACSRPGCPNNNRRQSPR